MAYTEKLLPVEALMAAWQNRRQNELQDNSAAKEREQLQNEMLKQQLESGKWQLQKEKDQATASMVPDKTAGMLTGEFGNFLSTRQPLSQMPGYVTGTNPAQYQAEQAALRQALAQGGGVKSMGGPTDAETNLTNQQANLVEEQGRIVQQQRQGYTTPAQKLAEMGIAAKTAATNDAAYDDLIKGARDESKSRWQDIGLGDKMINNTKSIGNEMKGEIDSSRKLEEAPGKAREYELRKLNTTRLSQDSTFYAARADVQQAILDLPIDDQQKLLDTVGKWDLPEKNEMLKTLPSIIDSYKKGGKLN